VTNTRANHTHLALARYHYANIRANPRLDPKGRSSIQVAAELPLMYARPPH
jgi:hypothetical protein